jgi:hypothetical protein
MSGYIMFKRVGRWHGLRLTDVPAAANLLRQRNSISGSEERPDISFLSGA